MLMLSKLASLILRLLGWKLIGERPPYKKYLMVGAPHTSNWDFLYFYLAALIFEIPITFMIKSDIFKGPLGPILRKMGGIPVIRSHSTNMVAQMIQAFNERDEMVLLIPPSGTRKRTDAWKSGFYHIAVGAGVPLALATMDYARKEVGISKVFMPSGDMKADMDIMREVYTPVTPKFPHEKSTIRLRQEDEIVSETKR